MKVILVRGRAIDPNINKFAEILARNGHEVKLLVWDRQHNLKDNFTNEYTVCKFNLITSYDKPIALLYIPIWWIYQILFLLKNKADVIHACDLDTLIPAIFIKIVKRVKLYYIIYDFYANNLPNGKFNLIRNLIRRIVAFVEKTSIHFVDFLFLTDESLSNEMDISRIHNLTFVFNSPNDYFPNKEIKVSLDKGKINIVYIGGLTKARGLENMIEAVKGLDNVELVIGGIGPLKDYIEEVSSDYRKIQYIGWTNSYKEVMDKTSEADITFRFGDPNLPANKYILPNKLFESMMCGKPIIVTDNTATANIVRKENCGLVVKYGSTNEIREAIIRLRDDVQLKKQLGENGRKSYENKYSWQIMERRILNAYSCINK